MTARLRIALLLCLGACTGENPDSGGVRAPDDAAAPTDARPGPRPDDGAEADAFRPQPPDASPADAAPPDPDAAPMSCPHPDGDRDLDGDGVSACAGDCDDRDPWVGPGALELCNGRDDDCDGRTDEDFAGVGRPCTVGVGACERAGMAECTPDQLEVHCAAAPGEPTAEVCNQQDDDCDGTVDDGVADCCTPGDTQPCGVDRGACTVGVAVCGPDRAYGACSGVGGAPEQCNGRDDDCDGEVDEDPSGLGEACDSGQPGRCARGRTACDGGVLRCAPLEAPRPEACNGEDDDCDGEVDEGVRNACGVCGPAAAEQCNGVDDDCDGLVDEGTRAAGGPCISSRGRAGGAATGAGFGAAVLVVPDQDGDGFRDVLVGAPGDERALPGRVYLVSGATGAVLAENGGRPDDLGLGASLAAGDLDGDGQPEWVAGAPAARAQNVEVGRVDVMRGRRLEVVGRLAGSGGRFGQAVAAVVPQGDHHAFLVVGAPEATAPDRPALAGRVETFEARPGGPPLRLESVWSRNGPAAHARAGEAVGFGPPDPGGLRWVAFPLVAEAMDAELSMRDPYTGNVRRRIQPESASLQTFGQAIDGRVAPWLAVGAWGAGDAARGRAWLYDGDAAIAARLTGSAPGDHLGFSVAVLPGAAADGRAAWCAGAVTSAIAAQAGIPRPGYVRCVTPAGAAWLELPGEDPSDGFGWSLSAADGPDPDGTRLLAVGAPAGLVEGLRAGVVHLYRRVPTP